MNMAYINKDIRYDRKDYKFRMTNHMQPTFNQDAQLKRICKWIVNTAADERKWFGEVQWYREIQQIVSSRIALIFPGHPLFPLLDQKSQMQSANWLIFTGPVEKSFQIWVNHFGPFGKEKREKFEDDLNRTNEKFKEWRTKFNISFESVFNNAVSQSTITQFKIGLEGEWQKLKNSMERNLEKKKQELVQISQETFGDSEGRIIVAEIERIGNKYLKKGVDFILGEIAVIIAKQLAKEIAIITAKNGTKEVGKMGAKKVPVAGLLVGGFFAVKKLIKGDVGGAGLELASGAASMVPGGGTAIYLQLMLD